VKLGDATQLLLVFSQLLKGRKPTTPSLIQCTLDLHEKAIRIRAHLLNLLILLNQIGWEDVIVFQPMIHVVRIEHGVSEFRKMHLKISLLRLEIKLKELLLYGISACSINPRLLCLCD
jgi:hypothetical protein